MAVSPGTAGVAFRQHTTKALLLEALWITIATLSMGYGVVFALRTRASWAASRHP
jgi:hypothetical protein